MGDVEQLKKKYNEEEKLKPSYLKENQEYDPERGIVITYDRKGRAFVSFPVSGVPLHQFEVWNKVCEEEFNSARWPKIYLDHKMNETVQTLTSPQEVQPEVEQKEEKKNSTLLNGEKIDDD